MNDVRKEIVRYIKKKKESGLLLLCRNEEERLFLKRFSETGPDIELCLSGSPKELLENTIGQCNLCGDVEDKKPGYGSGENGFMILLNPPTMLTAVERKKYKKPSIELLRKMLESIEVNMGECYVSSMIKCDLGDRIARPAEMFENCQKILRLEIEKIKPKTVLVFGDILPLKNMINSYQKIEWLSFDHPITLLNRPELKRKAWNTLKLARDLHEKGTPL